MLLWLLQACVNSCTNYDDKINETASPKVNDYIAIDDDGGVLNCYKGNDSPDCFVYCNGIYKPVSQCVVHPVFRNPK